MRLCINMLIFTHNLGNWLMGKLSHWHNISENLKKPVVYVMCTQHRLIASFNGAATSLTRLMNKYQCLLYGKFPCWEVSFTGNMVSP